MTYQVLWSDEALSAAQAYLEEDRAGVATVFDAVDQLEVEPRPPEAFPWGPGLFRIRIGRYRVIYEITETMVTVEVIRLGRTR